MNEPGQDRYSIPIAVIAAGCIIALLGAGLSFGLYISSATAHAMYVVGAVIASLGIISYLILFIFSQRRPK